MLLLNDTIDKIVSFYLPNQVLVGNYCSLSLTQLQLLFLHIQFESSHPITWYQFFVFKHNKIYSSMVI